MYGYSAQSSGTYYTFYRIYSDHLTIASNWSILQFYHLQNM